MVKPILEKLAQEYVGRVDLWQINADENQELLHELKVYGIPTLIIYRDGKETFRQVGAKSASALQNLFETLATGKEPTVVGPSSMDRFIRMGAGMAVAAICWVTHANWILFLLGSILMFSAIYDRCPIWQALTRQFKKLTSQA